MHIDFHVHSNASKDTVTKPETLIRVAKQKNLAIALTDHDTCDNWQAVSKLGKKLGVNVILGQEIKTIDENENSCGELMGIFLTKPIKSKFFKEVIAEIKAQKGLLVVPHPFDVVRQNFKRLNEILKEVDAIESLNARSFLPSFNEKAAKFALEHKLPQLAGSDAHIPEEIGAAYTIIKAKNLVEAKKQLLTGKTEVCGERSSYDVHLHSWLARKNLIKDR